MTQAQNTDSGGGWTLQQIQKEIEKTKRYMEKTGNREGIQTREFAEITGMSYNTAFVSLTRAKVTEIRRDYPTEFERVKALELAEAKLRRKQKSQTAPQDLADQALRAWLESGVPQTLQVLCERAGISTEGRSANRETRVGNKAVELGLVSFTEAIGRRFLLPHGAYVEAPKKKPKLTGLNATDKAIFEAVTRIYTERLFPPSMVELRELAGTKFPNYSMSKLIELGLIEQRTSGDMAVYVPVGWVARVKK